MRFCRRARDVRIMIEKTKSTIFAVAAIGLLLTPMPAPASETELGEPVRTNLAALPQGDAEVQKLAFDVLMDGSNIGEHVVTLTHRDNGTDVAVDVDIAVTFGPFTLYRYEQENRARWEGGELFAFRSVTNNDGDDYVVEAERTRAGLSVAVNGAEPLVLPQWFPTTYWDKRTVMQEALVATQDGVLKEVEITPAGAETLTVLGREIEARKYEMRGDIDLDLWYDDQDRWVKLAFSFRGNEFEYRLR